MIKEKQRVVDIITDSFKNNPSVISVIKNDKKQEKRLRILANYAYKTCLLRKGVYVSTDLTGVALCFHYNIKKESFKDYWNQLKLALFAIGLSRVLKMLKREAYIKSKRPKDGRFLYFWFFGVKEEGRGKGAAYELKQLIFNESEKKKLPIYLETSVEKNKKIYERYGFKTYHAWDDPNMKEILWFMRRP